MKMMKPETRATFLFWLALVSAVVTLLVVLALLGLEAYVRWTVNRDFSFLGGFELETLTASSFAVIFGLAFLYRRDTAD